MPQDDSLPCGSKHHVMLTDNVTATDRRKTDIAALTCTGDTIAPAIRDIGQCNTAPFGGCLAEHQRRTRRRVDFLIVMRLDHLDIKICVQCGRDPFGQLGQQVDAQAHVTSAHDNCLFRRCIQTGDLRIGHPRSAYDMDHTSCRSDFRKGEGRFGCGEINNRLRVFHRRCGIIGDEHADCCAAHGHTDVLTDPRMPCPFNRACKMHPVAG